MDLFNFWDSSQYEYPTTAAAQMEQERFAWSSPPPPAYDAPPASSWLGFGTLPDAIRSVTNAATTIAGVSLAKDRYVAERDIARANLEANTNIARYNALSRSYYAQADAAKARNEVAYVTGQAMRPAGTNGLILLGVIAAAAWAASQP